MAGESKSSGSGVDSTIKLFKDSWASLQQHKDLWIKLWFLAVVPVSVLSAVVALVFGLGTDSMVGTTGAIPPTLPGTGVVHLMLFMLVWAVVVGLYSIFVYSAEVSAFLAVTRDHKSPNINEIVKAGMDNLGKLLVLVVIMGVFIMLGLIALIIPGLILAVLFSFAPLILFDQDVDAFESLKRSARLVSDNFVKVLLFGLAAFLVNIGIGFVLALAQGISPFVVLDSLLSVAVNAVVTIYIGLGFTRLYLNLK